MPEPGPYGVRLSLDEALDIAIESEDNRVPVELLSASDRATYYELSRWVAVMRHVAMNTEAYVETDDASATE